MANQTRLRLLSDTKARKNPVQHVIRIDGTNDFSQARQSVAKFGSNEFFSGTGFGDR